MPATPQPWMTTAQVARLMGVSVSTVQRRVATPSDETGSIPHARVGPRLVRFDPDTLRDWMDAGCPSVDEFRRQRWMRGGAA